MNPMKNFDHPNCENILSCQNPVNIYNNKTLPLDFASWGGRVKISPDPHQYVQFGVYESNFSLGQTTGLNWTSQGRTGYFYAAEYGYHTAFGETAYPTTASIGVWHDSSKFTDPATGVPNSNGSSAVYLRGQRVLWRGDGGAAQGPASRYLTGFTTAAYSPTSAVPFRGYAEVGVNYHGLFDGRPRDHYGMKLAYLRVNDNELDAEQGALKAISGVDFRPKNNQFRLEFNGHIEVKRGIFIEPFVQFIKNPNLQFVTPGVAVQAPKSGINLGLVMFVSLPDLF